MILTRHLKVPSRGWLSICQKGLLRPSPSVKTECEKAWSDQFRITKSYPVPGLAVGSSATVPVDLAGSASKASVVILIKTGEDMWPWQSHWSITAHKLNSPIQNYVRDKSDVRFESTGLDSSVPYGGTKPRRSIVHEFGHMLGYRDEYPNSDRGTNAYVDDSESIMHFGEKVRERHYVLFEQPERALASWRPMEPRQHLSLRLVVTAVIGPGLRPVS